MRDFVHLLGESDLAALRVVLGQRVGQIYTRSLEVYEEFVRARHFSIALHARSYCVLGSDWADTPDDALDYHRMEAAVSDWPRGVGRIPSQPFNAPDDPSAVHLPYKPEPIVLVQVLEQRAASASEAVRYDHAIIFTRRDGFRFSFSAPNSIVGGLELTYVSARVDEFLAAHEERVSLS